MKPQIYNRNAPLDQRVPLNSETIPPPVRENLTNEDHARYARTLSPSASGLGPQYITARREVEVLCADKSLREFFAGYFPHEALAHLERCASHGGVSAADAARYRRNLFEHLDARCLPLFKAVDTHPDLVPHRDCYLKLRKSYMEGMAAAKRLKQARPQGAASDKRYHADCADVFNQHFDALHAVLHALCELCAYDRLGNS